VRQLLIGLVLAVEAAVLFAGCARPRAKTVPEVPPLEVPPPPSRVIPLPETDESDLAASAPAEKPAKVPPARPRPKPSAEPAAKDVKKPEGNPATEPPPPPQPGPPAAPLQTTPPANEGEMSRRVDGLLGQARGDIQRVKPSVLQTPDGKEQLDMAKRFIDQAEQAKKEKNYVLALKLAEKAATLASDLAAR
jgi:hypothetical protein